MQATLQIDGYDSFEQIALGGMATVYKARKKSIKKPVAIKVLFPHLAADERFTDRLKHEAEAAARIQHDNIVNVIDFGESDGSYYIVMEFYDGLTVEELLDDQPHLPMDIAYAIILNVCYGLEAAHAENLVHRDIKPANIILTRQGAVKVADFGLAKSTEQLKRTTLDGKVIGTPAYMSPEQAAGGRVGVPSDIFSLGVVAYELICGVRPFEGSGYMEVVDAIQHRTPEPAESHNPLVDESLEKILQRLLTKDPTDRYQTMSSVIADLEASMDKCGIRRDSRALTEFYGDPKAYTEERVNNLLEQLTGSTPTGGAGNKKAMVRYYRKVNFLDPSDEGARSQLVRLGVAPIERRKAQRRADARDGTDRRSKGVDPLADPNADYAIYLDAIDESVETCDSFALKLSLRIKTPLPRIRGMVRNIPCQLFAKVPYEKARKLVKVIRALGGDGRMEMLPTGPIASRNPTEPGLSRDPVAASPAEVDPARAPTEEQETRRRSIGWRGIKCPACGSAEEPDARFCSFCNYNLQTRAPIDEARLRARQEGTAENPLAAVTGGKWVARLLELPRHVLILSAVGIVALVLLVVFGR